MKNQNTMPLLIGIILVILSIGAAAFYLGRATGNPSTVNVTPTLVPTRTEQVATAQPTMAEEKSVDMKTYENDTYSFSYPSTWKMESVNDRVNLESVDYEESNPEVGYSKIVSGYSLEISTGSTQEKTAKEFFTNNTFISMGAKNVKDVEINNMQGVQYDFSYEASIARYTVFVKDNMVYYLSYAYAENEKDLNLNAYNTFLNSFKLK